MLWPHHYHVKPLQRSLWNIDAESITNRKFSSCPCLNADNTKRHKARQVPLKLLVVNFQSINSNKDRSKTSSRVPMQTSLLVQRPGLIQQLRTIRFSHLIMTSIGRTEIWLEVGSWIAIKNTLISEPVPELQTDCEIVWARINLVGAKTLYLSSYYHPKTSDEQSILEFQHSMERATRIHNAMFIIGGDFNFPGWIWKIKY